MSRPISAVGLYLLGYTLNAYVYPDSAVSSEAKAVREAACTVLESAERSQVLFGEKAAALSEIRSLAIECAQPNWDGDGAAAIGAFATLNAERFVRALPDDIPIPEFAPEPDGSISLDWIESRSRMFSVSVGASSRLAYAWLDGTDRGRGVARFDGKTLPKRLLDGINGIVSHGNTAIGPF